MWDAPLPAISGVCVITPAIGDLLRESVSFGPVTLSRPIAHASVSVNLIGQAYLKHYTVTFDQSRRLVSFEPKAGAGSVAVPSDPLRGTGVVLGPIGDSWQVIDVQRDAEFEDTVVQVGDTVLAVDGQPLEDRGCAVTDGSDDLAEWQELALSDGRTVRVRMRTLVN